MNIGKKPLIGDCVNSQNNLWPKLNDKFMSEASINPQFSNWLFADRQLARGLKGEMSFYHPLGPEQILRYFKYLNGFNLDTTALPAKARYLIDMAYMRDKRLLKDLGLYSPKLDKLLLEISKYNATDYWFYTKVPDITGDNIERVLDFGAGHGRQANLFFEPELHNGQRSMVSVDGIPGSYITAYNYYFALGINIQELLLDDSLGGSELVAKESSIMHIPTWRLNQLQARSTDLIICVQVLREISLEVLDFVLEQFQRVLKVGGFIYVRDHIDRHNPNGADQDAYLEKYGFRKEWSPDFKDKSDYFGLEHRIHGLPRIWRLTDNNEPNSIRIAH